MVSKILLIKKANKVTFNSVKDFITQKPNKGTGYAWHLHKLVLFVVNIDKQLYLNF